MFIIRYKTMDVRPDLSVTIRSTGQNWQEDLPGHYDNDEWVYHLDEAEYPEQIDGWQRGFANYHTGQDMP